MKNIIVIYTSFFYTGFFPKASGTIATAAFLPFYYFIFAGMPLWMYFLLTAAITAAGIWASNYAVEIFKAEDPSKVVIDEVSGFLVTMMFIPFTPERMAIGFFLSRFYDIVKFPPARQAEKLHGGTGIMLDDVIAGVYANLTLWALIFLRLDAAAAELFRHVFFS
ncbi:MAG: phosphatidylglycerophosphatase A [Candidatus Goldiibacteriota bacterium]